jgi:hypothetical protein
MFPVSYAMNYELPGHVTSYLVQPQTTVEIFEVGDSNAAITTPSEGTNAKVMTGLMSRLLETVGRARPTRPALARTPRTRRTANLTNDFRNQVVCSAANVCTEITSYRQRLRLPGHRRLSGSPRPERANPVHGFSDYLLADGHVKSHRM